MLPDSGLNEAGAVRRNEFKKIRLFLLTSLKNLSNIIITLWGRKQSCIGDGTNLWGLWE